LSKTFATITNMIGSGKWRIASTQSEFRDLKADWEHLFLGNPRHSPFLSWGWVDAWLQHIAGPHELQVAYQRDSGGALRFVLPLLRPAGKRKFGSGSLVLACSYGAECSDHLGCLCLAELEAQSAELCAQAIEYCAGPDEVVSLGVLDDTNNFASRLNESLEGYGRKSKIRADVVCPTVELADTWDGYLQDLSSNFRSQVRRSYKQIGGDGQPRFSEMDECRIPGFVQELIRLNRARIQSKGEISSLEDSAFRDFLADAVPYMCAQGIAWADSIESEGVVLGSALNFVHGDSVYYYMGGFDEQASKLRPGTALFAFVIQRSIDAGIKKFNFLRGPESYKYRWGAQDVLTHHVLIYPKSKLRRLLTFTADNLYVGARSLAKRLRRLLLRKG